MQPVACSPKLPCPHMNLVIQAEPLLVLHCYMTAECACVDLALYVHTLYNLIYENDTIF